MFPTNGHPLVLCVRKRDLKVINAKHAMKRRHEKDQLAGVSKCRVLGEMQQWPAYAYPTEDE